MKTAWTDDEIKTLVRMFRREPAHRICKAIPGRSWLSINAKAQKLALHRDKGHIEDTLELVEHIQRVLARKYPSRAQRGLW